MKLVRKTNRIGVVQNGSIDKISYTATTTAALELVHISGIPAVQLHSDCLPGRPQTYGRLLGKNQRGFLGF